MACGGFFHAVRGMRRREGRRFGLALLFGFPGIDVRDEFTRHGIGDGSVVDVGFEFFAGDVFSDVGFDGCEQGLVRFRVVEGLAGAGEGADTACGEEDGDWGRVAIDFLGDESADFRGFFRVGAHESDLRVVFVEQAIFELFGDGVFALEVDHVDTAWGDDGGQFCAGGGVETIGSCGEDATDDFVGEFGGGDVEDALDEAGVDDGFHGLTADAGAMEHEGFEARVFEHDFGAVDASGGVAKHAGDDGGLFFNGLEADVGFDHAADGSGGAGEDGAGDTVDTGDVHDAGEEDDVLRTDVLGGVAAREGGDDDFWKAEWQGLHRGGCDGCAASAPEGDDALNAFLFDECAERFRGDLAHFGDGSAAIFQGGQDAGVLVREGEDAFASVGRVNLGRLLSADVNEHGLVSGLTDPVCNECVFVSFGVEGSENGNGGHGGWVGSVFSECETVR